MTALRRAFDNAVIDPEFAADAEKQRAEISPMTGKETQQLVADLINVPLGVREKVKAAFLARTGIEEKPDAKGGK